MHKFSLGKSIFPLLKTNLFTLCLSATKRREKGGVRVGLNTPRNIFRKNRTLLFQQGYLQAGCQHETEYETKYNRTEKQTIEENIPALKSLEIKREEKKIWAQHRSSIEENSKIVAPEWRMVYSSSSSSSSSSAVMILKPEAFGLDD